MSQFIKQYEWKCPEQKCLSEFVFEKYIDSNSVSLSDIWVVRNKIDNKPYILKLWVDGFIKKDGTREVFPKRDLQMLRNETKIYNDITKDVIESQNVRNILFVKETETNVRFDTLLDMLEESKLLPREQFKNNLLFTTRQLFLSRITDGKDQKNIVYEESHGKLPDSLFKINGYDIQKEVLYAFICTPLIDGGNLYDIIGSMYKKVQERRPTLTDSEFLNKTMNYMTLILITLSIMAENGYNHNDLHFGNVLMSNEIFGINSYHTKNYFLVVDNMILFINNEYIPYIYDFDRTVKNGIEFNELEDFEQYGQCIKFNKHRDILKFLCSFMRLAIQIWPDQCEDIFSFIESVRSFSTKFKQYLRGNSIPKGNKEKLLRYFTKKDREEYIINKDCYFKKSDTESYLCDESLFKEGKTIPKHIDIIKFFIQKTTYPKYSLEDFKKKNISQEIKDYLHSLPKKDDKEFEKYLDVNIQIYPGTKINKQEIIGYLKSI